MSGVLKPCLSCGEPTDAGSYCDDCQPKRAPRPPRASRSAGYDTAWDLLSKRARRLQPWCSDCGATAKLACDHSPEAWRRHDAGLPIRLVDVDVVCARCNNRRGAARGSDQGGQGSQTEREGRMSVGETILHRGGV